MRQALRSDTDNLRARHLEVTALRRLGQADAARQRLTELRALDPLDAGGGYLAGEALGCDTQTRIDLAIELAGFGLLDEATSLLTASLDTADAGTRLWFVYPDFTPPFSPAFGVWLVTVLHWPKGDVELALALCCSFVATLSLTLLAWALWRMWCRR